MTTFMSHGTVRRLAVTVSILACGLIALSGCSKQTAEEKGAEMAQEKVDMVKGIGGVLEKHGSQAAESIAHGTGQVFSGLESGFEKSFGRTIVTAPSVKEAGLTVSKVQDATMNGDKTVHGIDAYVVAEKNVAGKLKLVARDKRKNEIARTAVALNLAAGDGRFESIELDSRTVLAEITEITFEFVPDTTAATAAK